MRCYDRIYNYISMVIVDEFIAACAHNNDENKLNEEDLSMYK